jgi:predicted DsbA family dithiol-disulfide isomerase
MRCVGMQVEIWSDVVCPWCYLGTHRFEQALGQFAHRDEVQVTHRSFQLDPDAPSGPRTTVVESLASKYGRTADQVEQMQSEMTARAAADGLTFELDGQLTGNTADAHRVLHLAAARGKQPEVVERLFRAHFTEQRSIFDAESLVELASEAGLAGPEVAAVLAGEDYRADVAEDLAQAREYGISGVPFFVIDGRFGISGAQPTEVLLAALEQTYASQTA